MHEVTGNFGSKDPLHRHGFRLLTEPVSDDEEVGIPLLSLDELLKDVDAYWRQW